MVVLVTGAGGTVGSAVVARLRGEGHHVRALVRAPVELPGVEQVVGDLTDGAGVQAAARGVELAIHCAASHARDLEEARFTNVEGTRNLTAALIASGHPAALVHISTVSVYDDAAGPDYDEDSPLGTDRDNAYGFTKAEAERVVADAVARGLPAIILRPTMVLSMHRRSRWGPGAVARARQLDQCLLPFPELPYVHVDNLVEAVLLAGQAAMKDGRAYNVSEGVANTDEYLSAVYEAARRPVIPVPPGAPVLRFSAERIGRELGWAPVDRWAEFLGQLRRS